MVPGAGPGLFTVTNVPPSLYVDLADLTQRPLRVATSPLATVSRLASDAVRDGRRARDPWRVAARSALEPVDACVLAPMIVIPGRKWTVIPDCLGAPPRAFGTSMADEVDRVAQVDPDKLLADLRDAASTPESQRRWSVARADPAWWLTAYAAALRRVWSAVKDLWVRATPLLERELERVGTASARGAVAELVASLQPRWPVVDGTWRMAGTETLRLHIQQDGLTVVPLLSGAHARGLWERAGPDGTEILTHVGYPLPGADRIFGRSPENGSTLDALVGEQRARILRRLDRPLTAGTVAEVIVGSPSAATHHLTALERSGLAVRERHGRNVVVRRTARGTALLALYE